MKKISLLLPVLLLLAGCRKDEVSGCGEPAPAGYRVFITSTTYAPSSSPASSAPHLVSVDNVEYPNLGVKLLTSLERTGNVLRLNYCGVTGGGPLTALGPAGSAVSLAGLPPQVYQLEITVRQRRTTGILDLTVSPARLTIADTTVAAVR